MSTHNPNQIQPLDDSTFESVLERRYARRDLLKGGFGAAIATMFGGVALVGCSDSNNGDDDGPGTPVAPTLAFTAVSKNLLDQITVPAGYTASLLYSLGDPINNTVPNWAGDGSETGASYTSRAGDHHDGMYYFGLSGTGTPSLTASERGILAMNHEAPNPFNTATGVNNLYVHASGATTTVVGGVATRTVPDECIKEINHHGVSVIEVNKTGANWSVNRNSTFNRRVTAATLMEISGPLRGNAAMFTKFSPGGTQTQGTVNNCANGHTPWGTYLTCEENWVGYFARAAGDNAKRTRAGEVASLNRYGSPENALSRLNWNTAGAGDEFQRWDTSVKGATAADDFRNVINQFGFVVEIDPYNPTAVPRKRTALGRFAHEGCWPGPVVAGRPVVFYMGDDNRGDYIYKFVSTALWDAADGTAAQTLGTDRMAIGSKYMDAGTLYVARFNADGSGTWLPLAGVAGALDTRIAADTAGATRMDRPEWGAVNPLTGEVYITLTNNNAAGRLATGTPTGTAALSDPANPRVYNDPKGATAQRGNPNGHIIRWRETGDLAAATTFQWDLYLFGARAASVDTNVNISGLVADNDFSSPDGLWFGRQGNAATGLLWIQTDDGAYTDVTNCMMLAAVPGTVGDGATRTVTGTAAGGETRVVTTKVGKAATTSNLRRFLVGCKECEITGIDSTPDGKTLFVNIQHPGEEKQATFNDPATFGSHWPGNQYLGNANARPRSSTIVITKNDGGVIGI
ncbi:hypothetical protein DFR24_1749 [Panacagrimonas perspica]|uniref:Phosphatase n=2 Tax=Panacagrimonas perspica TaxID=381431 RepID=A0A4S3KAD0_9GAMM|nr:PhoX family phosphatase [Panacagrimonas perspica]TDU32355.1 hypothetical protein DFR24_1749 [Panacagrimonas perspica]THD05290.1 hypothetical protein B1810_00635 [Panacagrimonas perspica]